MSRSQLAFLIAISVAGTSCRKSAAPAESHDASENEASIAPAEIDAGYYEPVFLDDVRDAIFHSAQTPVRFQDQKIDFIETFRAPPNGELAPVEKCTSPYKASPPPSFPGFPNLQRLQSPPCFRLVPGKIDPANVIPHAQMRARVRGVFHVDIDSDAGDIVYKSSLALDAIDALPDPDAVEMPITQAVADRVALQGRLISLRGETLTWFEGTPTLSPVETVPNDSGYQPDRRICMRALGDAVIGGTIGFIAFLHVRGRLVVAEKTNGCRATILVEHGERVTREQAR